MSITYKTSISVVARIECKRRYRIVMERTDSLLAFYRHAETACHRLDIKVTKFLNIKF